MMIFFSREQGNSLPRPPPPPPPPREDLRDAVISSSSNDISSTQKQTKKKKKKIPHATLLVFSTSDSWHKTYLWFPLFIFLYNFLFFPLAVWQWNRLPPCCAPALLRSCLHWINSVWQSGLLTIKCHKHNRPVFNPILVSPVFNS